MADRGSARMMDCRKERNMTRTEQFGDIEVRADFAQASDPIYARILPDGEFTQTPYQVADATHRPANAAALAAGYFSDQGAGACRINEDGTIEFD
jgi:hypothetical protein